MKKIAYIVNHLSFFESHLMPLALEARKKGYKIKIFCFVGGSKKMEYIATKEIKRKKIDFIRFDSLPNNLNIFSEILNTLRLTLEIRKYNPDIVHSISLKAVFASMLIHFFFNIKNHLCFITGMGFFSVQKLTLFQLFLKKFLFKIFSLIARKKKIKIVIENKTDYNFFNKEIILNKKNIFLVKGVGVNLKKFVYFKKRKKNIVLFSGRIIKEKGIEEFIEASKFLSKKFLNWKFIILGTLDHFKTNNLDINFNILKKNYKNILFLGYKKKVHNFFNKSLIVCLPSYREGFSKTLIEAAASGCAVITTDVPGCRDAIVNNKTGLLCKSRDCLSLIRKLEKLMLNKNQTYYFAKNAVKYAKKNFDQNIFISKNLKLYEK